MASGDRRVCDRKSSNDPMKRHDQMACDHQTLGRSEDCGRSPNFGRSEKERLVKPSPVLGTILDGLQILVCRRISDGRDDLQTLDGLQMVDDECRIFDDRWKPRRRSPNFGRSLEPSRRRPNFGRSLEPSRRSPNFRRSPKLVLGPVTSSKARTRTSRARTSRPTAIISFSREGDEWSAVR